MKKAITVILVMVMCFAMAGCDGRDKAEEDTQTENTEVSIKESEKDVEENTSADKQNIDGYYTVSTEDGQASINVPVPKGYQYTDYSTDTQLNYATDDMSQMILVALKNEEEAVVAEQISQEVQYLISANANGEEVVEDIQTYSEDGYEVSYFHYSYTGFEGCRIWTTLNDGNILTITAENVGDAAAVVDVDGIVRELIANIKD